VIINLNKCLTNLKWSYVHGFYLKNEKLRAFFQLQQGELEKLTDLIFELLIDIMDEKTKITKIDEFLDKK